MRFLKDKQNGTKIRSVVKLLIQINIENKIEVLSNIDSKTIKNEITNSEAEKPHVRRINDSIKVLRHTKINNETSGKNSINDNGMRIYFVKIQLNTELEIIENNAFK